MTYRVAQLPDVPGPVVLNHALDDPRRQPRVFSCGGYVEATVLPSGRQLDAKEVQEQASNVLAPLSEGWKCNLVARQAMEKRQAKASCFDDVLERGVGRRDETHVHTARSGATNGAYFTRLQHAQEHRLQVGRRFPDFVEKQRASVGAHEMPRMIAMGACERALHVSEQRRGRHRRWDGSHVDGDEGAGLETAAGFVDRLGDQLLSRSGGTSDQDRHMQIGHLSDLRANGLQRVALTHHSQPLRELCWKPALQMQHQHDTPR